MDGGGGGQASLCGRYEVCKLLLENGAICGRNYQGERYVSLPGGGGGILGADECSGRCIMH